jgi:putative ABC transport system ATP-binding protein
MSTPAPPLVAPTVNLSNGNVAAASVRNAVKQYGVGDGAIFALDDVSVDFNQGEFTAIMGPSGSGKSTLMHCAAGLDELTTGDVFIGDIALAGLKDAALTTLRRDNVGFIFQAFNLIPTLNAKENILLPMTLAGRAPDTAWVNTVIEAVGLGNRLNNRPSELSGGQQQRVAVARALAAKPKIIFADEPTGNLDSTTGAEILNFMKRATQEFGQTIVMVTHDPNAASYANRVLFLNDGKIVDEMRDPTEDLVLNRMRRFTR